MATSSYQVQRMVSRLRRARQSAARALGVAPDAASAGADRVQLSLRAREQAAAAADSLRLPAGTPVSPATIVDDAPLPLPVRIELERRAGSFMRPPLAPAPSPAAIPRVRRKREAQAEPDSAESSDDGA
jgi:hypothetical protein